MGDGDRDRVLPCVEGREVDCGGMGGGTVVRGGELRIIGGGCPAGWDVMGSGVVVAEGLREPDERRCRRSLTRFRAAGRVMRDPPDGDPVGGVAVRLGMWLAGRVPNRLTADRTAVLMGLPTSEVVGAGGSARRSQIWSAVSAVG